MIKREREKFREIERDKEIERVGERERERERGKNEIDKIRIISAACVHY